MRTVYAQKNKKIVLGRQGEDKAVRVVWPGIVSDWSSLYGDGSFQLSVRRFGDENAYPVVVEVNGDDISFIVTSAETAIAGIGKCELTYIANRSIAKSATWETIVLNSLTGQTPSEPPEEPAMSWFTSIQGQIGNLGNLSTASKDSLVAAINEAAQSGGGGGTPVTEQTVSDWGFTKNTGTYSKPSGGIPKTDLADDVQASLRKANSALQEHQDVSGKQDTLIQSGAAVGQIAKITAVDDSGKPTAWEASNMPSVGGDTLLYHYDTSEDAIITSTALMPNLDISTTALLLFKWHINGYGTAEFGGRLMINNQPITQYFPYIHRKAGNTMDIFCAVAVLDATLTVIKFIADSDYFTNSADFVYEKGGTGYSNIINIPNSGIIESFGIQGATVTGSTPQDKGENLDYTTSGFSVDVYKVV